MAMICTFAQRNRATFRDI